MHQACIRLTISPNSRDGYSEGFPYLQQATQKGDLLMLSWTPATADGKPFPAFRAQFRIDR